MKLIVTVLAGALVAAGARDGAPIYPAPGQSATYRIQNVLPRSGATDDVVAIRTVDPDSATISVSGMPPMHVSLGADRAGDVDRRIAPILEALDATNAVAQSAIAGAPSVDIPVGPDANVAHLSITTAGEHVVAMGSADFLTVLIRITLRDGRVVDSAGTVEPKDGRGPARCWKLTLQP